MLIVRLLGSLRFGRCWVSTQTQYAQGSGLASSRLLWSTPPDKVAASSKDTFSFIKEKPKSNSRGSLEVSPFVSWDNTLYQGRVSTSVMLKKTSIVEQNRDYRTKEKVKK